AAAAPAAAAPTVIAAADVGHRVATAAPAAAVAAAPAAAVAARVAGRRDGRAATLVVAAQPAERQQHSDRSLHVVPPKSRSRWGSRTAGNRTDARRQRRDGGMQRPGRPGRISYATRRVAFVPNSLLTSRKF